MISEVVEVPDNQVGLITLFLGARLRLFYVLALLRRQATAAFPLAAKR